MAGTLTRLQMVNEVLDNISRLSTSTARSSTTLATRAVTWLDRAAIKIARKHQFLFAEATATTSANTKDYSLPSNTRGIFTVRLEDGTNSRKLECVLPWSFDGRYPKPDSDSTGVPLIYVPYRSCPDFELYPVPDASYPMRIRYSYWPAALSSDSSTSDFTRLDDVLVCFATSEGFRWLQELQDAKFWETRGYEALEEAIKADQDLYPDWAPQGIGYDSRLETGIMGEYWNNPFIVSNP